MLADCSLFDIHFSSDIPLSALSRAAVVAHFDCFVEDGSLFFRQQVNEFWILN